MTYYIFFHNAFITMNPRASLCINMYITVIVSSYLCPLKFKYIV